MTTTHAPSQISDADQARLLVAALNSSSHASTWTLIEGVQVGTQEMLSRYFLETPTGPIWIVRMERVLDGEGLLFDVAYRDEQDALDVFVHIVAEARGQ